ncbi:MAG: hypothetical protein U0470_01735 [Anaerolineae bacterium]
MVSGADYFDAAIDGAVGIALAHRQPGSAIKPIAYAAAFDTTRWGVRAAAAGDDPTRPSSAVHAGHRALRRADELHDPRGRAGHRPMNYDRAPGATIGLRRALATSSNMVAVKV